MNVQGNEEPRVEHESPSTLSVTRLLAVVVLYKLRPEESSTIRSLLAAVASVSCDELHLKVVVWDNTPGGQEIGKLSDGMVYKAAPANPGLAVAYNEALALAEAEGYEWLLTLDQDSVLPANFLKRILELVRELSLQQVIGAIVPQVISKDRVISPFHFLFNAIPRWFPAGFTGAFKSAVYAANSGSVLRVSALRLINGYDPLFPLDLSDTNMFHRLHSSGKRVFIAGDLSMQHDFALLNKQARMNVERYDASLLDDCAFWDLHMGALARFERIVRFTVRALRESFTPAMGDFRKRTVLEIRRRLFTTRKTRVAEWRIWVHRGRRSNLHHKAGA